MSILLSENSKVHLANRIFGFCKRKHFQKDLHTLSLHRLAFCWLPTYPNCKPNFWRPPYVCIELFTIQFQNVTTSIQHFSYRLCFWEFQFLHILAKDLKNRIEKNFSFHKVNCRWLNIPSEMGRNWSYECQAGRLVTCL